MKKIPATYQKAPREISPREYLERLQKGESLKSVRIVLPKSGSVGFPKLVIQE